MESFLNTCHELRSGIRNENMSFVLSRILLKLANQHKEEINKNTYNYCFTWLPSLNFHKLRVEFAFTDFGTRKNLIYSKVHPEYEITCITNFKWETKKINKLLDNPK